MKLQSLVAFIIQTHRHHLVSNEGPNSVTKEPRKDNQEEAKDTDDTEDYSQQDLTVEKHEKESIPFQKGIRAKNGCNGYKKHKVFTNVEKALTRKEHEERADKNTTTREESEDTTELMDQTAEESDTPVRRPAIIHTWVIRKNLLI